VSQSTAKTFIFRNMHKLFLYYFNKPWF